MAKSYVYKFIMKNGNIKYAVGVAISASKYGLVYVHDETGEKIEILPKKKIAKAYVMKFDNKEAAYHYYAKKIGLLK